MQAKILRVLQEKEVRRVGGNASIPVDVRIIAATNKNLARLMQEARFREDLYYRLNVLTIFLPPLRERTTDIPRLVDHFIARHAASGRVRGIDDRALAALMQYHWPGNVRQLESVIERAALLAESPMIVLDDLPQEVRQTREAGALGIAIPDAGISFEILEKELLEQALRKGRSVSAAARLLGMTRRTLQDRLKKFGLESSVPGDPPADEGAPAASKAPARSLSTAPNGAAGAPDR
jgi:transcriptional regulator with PAS, ATPase and Fis domain